jgi:predicted Zn finger-like uncharacterized protein
MSRMFTTCPACNLNLAVTAQDLRVGQGYVRCGRCEHVFNALLALAEDIDPAEQSGVAATGTTSVPALDDPEVTGIAHFPLEAADEATDTALDFDLTDTGLKELPEIVMIDEPDGEDTDEVPQASFDDAGPMEEPVALIEEVEALEADEEAVAEAPAELDADAAVGNPPRRHWLWGVAAGLLALLLVGQFVHHNRQSLVAQPWLEAPLAALYRGFGVTLEPRWDLKAYDLRQLGGEAMGTSTTIVVRASVHNQATNRQPPPMIRAVLRDRYGNVLSTTAVPPQDWLRGAAPARMAPDQRLDAELRLSDPNRQAVGFELDACLPAASGALHCSNDP